MKVEHLKFKLENKFNKSNQEMTVLILHIKNTLEKLTDKGKWHIYKNKIDYKQYKDKKKTNNKKLFSLQKTTWEKLLIHL